MPVLLDRAQVRRDPAGGEWIEIGLVNNMPDAALEATEQQFLELLAAAAGANCVRLRFFELTSIPRGEHARRYLRQSYGDAARIGEANLDGLIVTGTEPKAARLRDEPYWDAFIGLLDWARQNTISSIWSCLAVHAAVLHLDRIERERLAEKCIGVFAFDKRNDHPLTQNLPAQITFPHARWNGLSEAALAEGGYQVLTHSAAAGVDTFVRHQGSLMLFFQGHPEYGASALLSEYRRDVARFLRGEREDYPRMPQHYFGPATEAALAAFRQRAESAPREELMAEFPAAAAEMSMPPRWQPFSAAIYRNWLAYISDEKQRRPHPEQDLKGMRLNEVPGEAPRPAI